jgi:hypothetical protein
MNGTKYLLLAATLAVSLGVHAPQALSAPSSISACQTISLSGSYVLTNNLTAAGDCLILAADYITIDLAGFTIAGNGTGSGIKGSGGTRKGITVRNGTVRHFVNGINFAFDGIYMLFEQLRILDNSNTGAGANEVAIVKDSLFYGNGIGIYAGSRSVITGNVARGNTDGLNIGSGSTLIGNTSGINSRDGIQVGNGSTLVNNTAHGNSRYGFLVDCRSNLMGNTATLNSTSNFQLDTTLGACLQSHNLAP